MKTKSYKLDFLKQDTLDVTERSTVTVNFRKAKKGWETVVGGLKYTQDPSTDSAKAMLKKFKQQICSCNGHISTDGEYILRGDQRDPIKAYLSKIGVSDIIESGTG